MSGLEFLLAGTLAAALPMLLAALGEMVVEKTGLLNLGLEGMMALGAAIAFICVYHSGSHGLGFLAAAFAGALLSMLFAILVIGVRANAVATGLAVGVLGLGLSALFGKSYESLTVDGLPEIGLPVLSQIPLVGPTLFTQDIVVWLTILGTVGLWYVLNRTKLGLIISAVGENAEAARAIGYQVGAIRCAAVGFGGALCGLAGAYASTVYTPLWADGMIAGRGWIALALVVFGTWKTGRVVFGALLFGLLSLGELTAQAVGVGLPSQLLSSLPYIVTILMLTVISSRGLKSRT
ncbi:ABC transporter permease [Hoeflea prorocentri]|uniref:ABC transporter permease n=1 Tax=Hoeflea prorocentri TaxID=1922333 RepID=A0A9X3ZGT6_9HYPH|nr:ABC transporter permease [Hoeflea prorocentri]MCY6380085.1 ABC transporter permease [Hoeflea prorocentri]MDA5397885.1 ABC transporter permease [Hoeflea prorocentri]